MEKLTDIVREETEQYAGPSLNATLQVVNDEARQVYTVISIGKPPANEPARAVVMARVTDDFVVIESDTTDKPLVNALIQRGIPRKKIILAYQGESLPETI